VGVSTDATMTKPIDPNELNRDERIRELANILARGLVRIFDAASSVDGILKNEPQNPSNEP
jgi:hypothetical protein